MSEIIAKSRYVKSSPRKLRAVAKLVVRKNAQKGMTILAFTDKKAAGILSKTIKSAVYNAVNNFNLEKEDLIIKSIMVDQGPTMKRYRAMARGSANVYNKRTAHITVILETKVTSTKKVAKKTDTDSTHVTVKKPATKGTKAKSAPKKSPAKAKGSKTEVKVVSRKEKKATAKK